MNRSVIKSSQRWLRFWPLQFAGWSLYAVMIYLTFLPVAAEGNALRLLHVKFVRAVIGFGLSCLLRLIYRRWARNLSPAATALIVIFGALIFGSLWPALGKAYASLLESSFDWREGLARYPREALEYTVTLIAWSALYFGVKYWQAWEGERERALQASWLAQQAQLEMLRYQLNPHFLFNALNSIRASIDEDPRRARRMVTEFSEFLRYSLLNGNLEHTRLRDEISAIRNYLAIEKIRFEERLDAAIDVEPQAAEFQLPGFLIYPLVENAIKHGLTGDSTLTLRLSARLGDDALRVEVSNTGRWIEPEAGGNGTGIGLNNIRQRLDKLFPGRSRFHIGEDDGWIRAVIEISRR